MSLLQLKQLTVRFGGLTAVGKLDLDIESGRIVSIIGPNGAGKTTVFNVITGIYSPTEGEIRFNDSDLQRSLTPHTIVGFALVSLAMALGLLISLHAQTLWENTFTVNYVYQQAFPWRKAATDAMSFFGNLPAREKWIPLLVGAAIGGAGAFAAWSRSRRTPDVIVHNGIARTFQNIRLFPQMTALDNVLVGMDAHLRTRLWHAALRLPRFWREQKESGARAMEILRFVGLENEARSAASSLPYGRQRRLEIARALGTEPKLLLLDEPGAGMNPQEIADIIALIRKIRDCGITVLLIEHHMQVVMDISDRIAVLDHGEKIAEGTPAEVRCDPKVIEAYLGKDAEN